MCFRIVPFWSLIGDGDFPQLSCRGSLSAIQLLCPFQNFARGDGRWVDADSPAAVSGTITALPHLGHLTVLPASAEFALSFVPQPEQGKDSDAASDFVCSVLVVPS